MAQKEELKIAMLGPSGVGKTSLLTALYQQFNATIGTTNLQLTPDQESAAILDQRLNDLKNMTYEFKIRPGDGLANSEEMRSFVFGIGKKATIPSFHLSFTDYPGAYILDRANPAGHERVRTLLRESAVTLIAIDAPALMEVQGRWNGLINRPNLITTMLQEAYANLKEPRMVVFAPVKCEKYVRDPISAGKLRRAIKEAYADLFRLLSAETIRQYVVAAIIPIQTVGCVLFSRIEEEEISGANGRIITVPSFYYRKERFNDVYDPVNSEQLLRYLLRFLFKIAADRKRTENGWIYRFIYDWFSDKYLEEAARAFAAVYKNTGEFEIVQGSQWLSL